MIPSIALRLGLIPAGTLTTHTASGSPVVNEYEVSLSISGPAGAAGPMFVRPTLGVTELAYVPPTIDVLVGLDILGELVTVIDGPGKWFSISF